MKADRTKRGGADVEQERRAARFRKVFSTVDGRRVLEDLIERSGMNGSLFAADARVQEHNVARNDFMVWVLEQINGKQKNKTKDNHEAE